MLIKRLYVPSSDLVSTELQEIDMPRLGRYVALAGKNGAGKSRLLSVLEQQVMTRSEAILKVPNLRQEIRDCEQSIQQNPAHPAISKWEKQIDQRQQQLKNILERVVANEQAQFKALRFVPKNLNLDDPRQQSSQTLSDRSSAASNAPIESYQTHCLPYIQKLQNRWWSVTHQGYFGDLEEKEAAIAAYEKLNALTLALLGVPLDRNADDDATIFQKPLADAALSDGQKVILQFVVALHAQKGTLDNTVFILDELENHLHPSAVIDLLNKLDEVAPTSQIWIATHSVSLLACIAHKDPMALWYMEDGRATHAGRHPERVLQGLLGNEERIGQLHSFTGLPAQLAAVNYAVESLLPPKTVGIEKGDPQIRQITRLLEAQTNSRALAVLDFGAGQGRLLEGLAADREAEEVVTKSITWHSIRFHKTAMRAVP